ncbi:uncharacterized protein LOC121918353 [Sceloporus undulatus]|uniref:uncharacterized protein LOC121918353 n=1 Tax=Sceloporus undulatus TaxID=8520 RepID=UPI001C4D9596|nr:uncharacterized protein LOC121918353 [Sceloporus undulatus]
MLAAESLPLLMDNGEVKEAPLGAAEKEKDDGEKMNDEGSVNSRDLDGNACPGQAECNPGPSSDRVPEPQRASDKEQGDQGFDVDKLNPSSTYEDIHRLCKMYPHFSRKVMFHTVDTIAQKHVGLMVEHFLTSSKTVCDTLMFEVLFSPKCNITECLRFFLQEANVGSLVQDSETQLLNKVKAIRAIAAITRCTNDAQDLNPWLPYHFVTLANVLVSQAQHMEKGTNKTFKKYMVPGEAIDILATLIQRLNLVGEMSSKLCPPE